MRCSFRNSCIALLPAAAAGLVITSVDVFAQPASSQASGGTRVEEVYVVAPHEVTRKTVGRSTIGAPIEEVTLTHRVSYADLDLTKQADIDALNARVKDSAARGCQELDQLYPAALDLTSPMPKTCTEMAMDGAMPQVAEAVESARR